MSDELENSKKEEATDKAFPEASMPKNQESELRALSVIGDINEEACRETLGAMWFLHSSAVVEELTNPEDLECADTKEVIRPFEMLISTNGGNADEMMAIYDAMRYIREEVEIITFGLGKVMSAGTLLLAAGTKGKRRIGKHCRVMVHSVIGGHVGPMHQLDNEMKEIKIIQESYIKALCEETNLTEKQLRSWLKKKVNIYLTAEEAVKYGFADIVI